MRAPRWGSGTPSWVAAAVRADLIALTQTRDDNVPPPQRKRMMPTGPTPVPPCPRLSPDPPPAAAEHNSVNHPSHYTAHPYRCECGRGVECIDVIEWWPANLAMAGKYLWRAGLKGDVIEDLRKSAWYVEREIQRRLQTGQFEERVP